MSDFCCIYDANLYFFPSAAGTAPNSLSGDNPAGSNTDGFDTAGNDITSCVHLLISHLVLADVVFIVTGCTVNNQDDCLSINKGTNIVFENNVCEGIGHGISIVRLSFCSLDVD